MLKIISGRIAEGKSQILIEQIGKRIFEKKKSILIVPDHATYNFEQRLCLQLNIEGFIDAEVCSFNRFASKILEYFGKGKKTYLDDCAKSMVLRRCVSDCHENLTIFKRASSRKGFTARCLEMISTLENCGYSPEYVLSVAEKLEDGILKQKLTDTALIFSAYSSFLERGYTDNADRLASAQALIPHYEPLKDTVIFIDGFDVFTSRLTDFIGALMQNCDVVISIADAQGKNDGNAYKIHEKTKEKIIQLAKDNCVEYSLETVSLKEKNKSDEIHFLQDNFYSSKPQIFDAECENIFINYFHSPSDEVTLTAMSIAQKVRSGARYKDFAVICNDLEKYTPLVTAIFNRFGIPVYTDTEHNIVSHPVSTFIFSAIKCAFMGFSPETVTDYVNSTLTDLSREEADFFLSFIHDKCLKNYEIESGLKFARAKDAEQARFELLRQKTVQPLLQFREALVSAKDARQKAQACYDFLVQNKVYEKISVLIDKYESIQAYKLSDITAQLWNIMQKLLEDLASLLDEDSITVKEFYETLFEGFSSCHVSTIPSVLDSVTFGDLTCAKEQNVLHTFVMGVNDGIIPAIYSDERLVTPAESSILMELGLELAHSEDTQDARMRYNVYSALCSPKCTLTVSCPLFTEGGVALRRSYLFERLLTLFPQLKAKADSSGNTEKYFHTLTSKDDFITPLSQEQLLLAIAKDGTSPEAEALRSYFVHAESKEFTLLKNALKKRNDILPKDLAIKLFSSDRHTSISRLEAFAKCPFQHFVQYGLSPKEHIEYSTNSLDMGTFFHSILENFIKENWNKELSEAECNGITGELFDKIIPEINFGAMTFTSRQRQVNYHLKNIVCKSAWEIKNQLKRYKPLGEEIEFGFGKIPPIEIETDFGTLYIKGKIDRADTLEKNGNVYIRIIDYKSGKKNKKSSTFGAEISEGTNLQLMIYMNALLSYLGGNSRPGGAYYMFLADGNSLVGLENSEVTETESKTATEPADFNRLLETAQNTAKELASGIFNGNIVPKHGKNTCQYCDYQSVCGIKVMNSKEDGEND
ncbi:MAG: PD-(D/E)XK nuclease family protein [Clostridia bacterium]|nr:PD-(D/E)XK nuclease family protein [Clostridia bacterium]